MSFVLVPERLRDCVPVPHDLVHEVHAPHCVCAQSTGQFAWKFESSGVQLRFWPRSADSHALPPCLAWVTLRKRIAVASPQVAEHAEYDPHCDAGWQSTGHC